MGGAFPDQTDPALLRLHQIPLHIPGRDPGSPEEHRSGGGEVDTIAPIRLLEEPDGQILPVLGHPLGLQIIPGGSFHELPDRFGGGHRVPGRHLMVQQDLLGFRHGILRQLQIASGHRGGGEVLLTPQMLPVADQRDAVEDLLRGPGGVQYHTVGDLGAYHGIGGDVQMVPLAQLGQLHGAPCIPPPHGQGEVLLHPTGGSGPAHSVIHIMVPAPEIQEP